MLKKINRLLKLIGFNLVHAKKIKKTCTPSPTCCVEKYNPGKTHYVGDDCPGGHSDCAPKQPSSDNNITGPTS